MLATTYGAARLALTPDQAHTSGSPWTCGPNENSEEAMRPT
jgi:hypothetical protein